MVYKAWLLRECLINYRTPLGIKCRCFITLMFLTCQVTLQNLICRFHILFWARKSMANVGGRTWKAVWNFQASLFGLCFLIEDILKWFVKLSTGWDTWFVRVCSDNPVLYSSRYLLYPTIVFWLFLKFIKNSMNSFQPPFLYLPNENYYLLLFVFFSPLRFYYTVSSWHFPTFLTTRLMRIYLILDTWHMFSISYLKYPWDLSVTIAVVQRSIMRLKECNNLLKFKYSLDQTQGFLILKPGHEHFSSHLLSDSQILLFWFLFLHLHSCSNFVVLKFLWIKNHFENVVNLWTYFSEKCIQK